VGNIKGPTYLVTEPTEWQLEEWRGSRKKRPKDRHDEQVLREIRDTSVA